LGFLPLGQHQPQIQLGINQRDQPRAPQTTLLRHRPKHRRPWRSRSAGRAPARPSARSTASSRCAPPGPDLRCSGRLTVKHGPHGRPTPYRQHLALYHEQKLGPVPIQASSTALPSELGFGHDAASTRSLTAAPELNLVRLRAAAIAKISLYQERETSPSRRDPNYQSALRHSQWRYPGRRSE
jgi:hypothetical protein